MDCPKCGRPRVPGDECPHCGIVYAKFRPAAPERPAPSPASGGRKAPLAVAVAVAIAAAGSVAAVVLARAHRAQRDQVEEVQVAAAPAASTPAEEGERVEPGPSPVAAPVPIAASAPAPPPAVEPDAAAEGAGEPGPAARDAPVPEPASCAVYSPDDIPAAAPHPTASPTWYEGASGFRRAAGEQASSGAPLLVLFYTDWCPHCRRFMAEVLPSAEMRGLGERVVKAKVNPEASGDDGDLARKFAVTSYPTLLVFGAPGAAPQRVRQWGSPRSFVEACEQALTEPARGHLASGVSLARAGSPEKAAAELKAAAGDRRFSAMALDQLGVLALRASCFERAVAIYARILEADPAYQGGRARYLRGVAYYRRGDVARALEDADGACRAGYREACQVAERLRGPGR